MAYRLVRTLVYKRGVGIREKGFWVAPRGEDVPAGDTTTEVSGLVWSQEIVPSAARGMRL